MGKERRNKFLAVKKEDKMNDPIKIEAVDMIESGLASFLADSYTLYLKTQSFHWNVTGSDFYQLHELFAKQYQNMASAIDEIAERMRALDYRTPGSFQEYIRLKSIPEDTGLHDSQNMIDSLMRDHETLSIKARELRMELERVQDEVTIDILNERSKFHDKSAWMLKSLLK